MSRFDKRSEEEHEARLKSQKNNESEELNKIYAYFLLKDSDVFTIHNHFTSKALKFGTSCTYDEFLLMLNMESSELLRTLFEILTLSTQKLHIDVFLKFCLYFGLLEMEPLLKQVISLFESYYGEKHKNCIFEEYLRFVPDSIMKQDEKLFCLYSYMSYLLNFKLLFSQYQTSKRTPPFLLPLMEIQDNIQKNILTKIRSKHLFKLKRHIHEILAYKQVHLKNPPLSICELVTTCIYHDNPYEYNYCLTYTELDYYKLPLLIQFTMKNHKIFRNNNLNTINVNANNNVIINPNNNINTNMNNNVNVNVNNHTSSSNSHNKGIERNSSTNNHSIFNSFTSSVDNNSRFCVSLRNTTTRKQSHMRNVNHIPSLYRI